MTHTKLMESRNIDIPPDDQVPYRIRDWRAGGNQVAAREWYFAMLEMEDHQQTMCIGK